MLRKGLLDYIRSLSVRFGRLRAEILSSDSGLSKREKNTFNASRGSFLSSGILSAWDRMKILTFSRVLVRLETEKEKKMSRVERFS